MSAMDEILDIDHSLLPAYLKEWGLCDETIGNFIGTYNLPFICT